MKRSLLLTSMLLAVIAPALAHEPPPAATEAAPQLEPLDAPPIAARSQAPPEAPAWTGPTVTLQTTMGDITITLDTVGAPKTSAQFLGLVKSGHYNGAAFYRIEPGFVIQLGDLDAKLQHRVPKLPPVKLETENNGHVRGAVGLAHGDDPDSGQSTFYIDLGENSGLNATPGAKPNTTGYAAFGHVTVGMDVADAIGTVELALAGGPFPGKLPKTAIVVRKAVAATAQ